MKQIIVHIGNYKTGSTSIQNAINANRDRLISGGYYIPQSGFAEGAHHDWARSWLNRPMAPPADILYENIRSELEQTECEKILISSEVFFTGEFAHKMVEALPGYTCRLICYLRRPDHFYSAFYQQLIKHAYFRETQKPTIELLKTSKSTQYLATLNAWADAVGEENVEVYPFEKDQLGEGLLPHFFQTVGVDEPETYQTESESNTDNVTIHNELLEYLRASNSIEYSRNEHMALLKLLTHIAHLPGADKAFHKKNAFSPDERRQILAETKSDIETITKRFARLSSVDQPLFLEGPVDDDPDWQQTYLDTEALARISAAIWIKQQANTIDVLSKMSYAKDNVVSFLMSADERIREKFK